MTPALYGAWLAAAPLLAAIAAWTIRRLRHAGRRIDAALAELHHTDPRKEDTHG